MQCHLLTKYILSAKGEGAIQQQDYQENVFTKDEFFIKVGQVLSSGRRNMGSGAFYNVLISYTHPKTCKGNEKNPKCTGKKLNGTIVLLTIPVLQVTTHNNII